LQTLNAVEAYFGEYAFRRWRPGRNTWKQQVLAALYDAEMLACRGLTIKEASSKRKRTEEALKQLFTDGEFNKSINANTNTPSYLRTRTYKVMNLLKNG